jgi:hypothetical protein
MDGSINSALAQPLFQFLRKQAFAANARQGPVLEPVSPGLDNNRFDGQVRIKSAQERRHMLCLPESEGRTAAA